MSATRKLFGTVAAMTLMCTAPVAVANPTSARRNALAGMALLGAAGYDAVVGFDGGLLARGGRVVRYVDLQAGHTYAVGAGGCDDAFDVDVAVVDPAGRIIAVDTTDNTEAAVRIDATMTGTYTVVVELADSTWDGAHWILLVNTPSSVSSR